MNPDWCLLIVGSLLRRKERFEPSLMSTIQDDLTTSHPSLPIPTSQVSLSLVVIVCILFLIWHSWTARSFLNFAFPSWILRSCEKYMRSWGSGEVMDENRCSPPPAVQELWLTIVPGGYWLRHKTYHTVSLKVSVAEIPPHDLQVPPWPSCGESVGQGQIILGGPQNSLFFLLNISAS